MTYLINVYYHSLATGTGFSVDVGTAVIEHSVKVSEPALHRKIYRYRYSIIIVSVYRYHNFWRNFSRPSGRFSTNHSVEFKCLQVYWHLYNRFIKRNKPRKNLLNSEVFSFKLGFILRIWRAPNLDNSLVSVSKHKILVCYNNKLNKLKFCNLRPILGYYLNLKLSIYAR